MSELMIHQKMQTSPSIQNVAPFCHLHSTIYSPSYRVIPLKQGGCGWYPPFNPLNRTSTEIEAKAPWCGQGQLSSTGLAKYLSWHQNGGSHFRTICPAQRESNPFSFPISSRKVQL